MLLSEEFAIGRINARETVERDREIEMARRVREEQTRRRIVASPADAVVAGAESLLRARAEHPAGTRRSEAVSEASGDARELQSAGR
ncbi:hypothetical protein [Leifsonia sp. NPDC058230]|uniref:hypothetical protein n=1 Tax=Leifsonia sp. NPDC058230 TaxID=3346391 RepID=UPI0036DBE477